MEKTDLRLESFKMIREWSTWLVGIQTVICGFLWNVLKENPLFLAEFRGMPNPSFTGMILHLAWLAFAFSLVTAAFTLISLPKLVETLKQEDGAAESVFAMQANVWGGKMNLRTLVGAQHILFFIGVVLAALFVIMT